MVVALTLPCPEAQVASCRERDLTRDGCCVLPGLRLGHAVRKEEPRRSGLWGADVAQQEAVSHQAWKGGYDGTFSFIRGFVSACVCSRHLANTELWCTERKSQRSRVEQDPASALQNTPV